MEGLIKYKLMSSMLFTVLAGCAGQTTAADAPDLSGDFGTLNGASLDLTSTGGIAAFQSHQVVRHDDLSFLSTNGRICSTKCDAPFDSTSGKLSAAAADSLFNIVWQQNPFSLKDDYGITRQAADMMTYTLKIVINGRSKTITADDGSMPPAMHTIVNSVRGIIAAAR
jgi:hypothetical protein